MNSKEKNSTEDIERFWKTLWKPYNRWLLLPGAIILLIVAAIPEFSGDGVTWATTGSVLKTFATEIGFAFIIAALLSASIEESTRRQFYAEMDSRIIDIQKNVFRSTYSRNLPDQFFNEVEELLFRCEFSYSNYRIEYDFSWSHSLAKTSSPPVMDVRISHMFSVRNITAFASEHCIRLQVQELPYLSDANCPKLISVILRGHSTLEPEKIEKINNDAQSDGGIKTFLIQTDQVPPSESIDVEINVQSAKYADGVAFCRCLAPSSGLIVVAKFPVGIDLDRVGADTAHRMPCKRTSVEREKKKFTWGIVGPVLPSQGINFWWAPDLAQVPEVKVKQ